MSSTFYVYCSTCVNVQGSSGSSELVAGGDQANVQGSSGSSELVAVGDQAMPAGLVELQQKIKYVECACVLWSIYLSNTVYVLSYSTDSACTCTGTFEFVRLQSELNKHTTTLFVYSDAKVNQKQILCTCTECTCVYISCTDKQRRLGPSWLSYKACCLCYRRWYVPTLYTTTCSLTSMTLCTVFTDEIVETHAYMYTYNNCITE